MSSFAPSWAAPDHRVTIAFASGIMSRHFPVSTSSGRVGRWYHSPRALVAGLVVALATACGTRDTVGIVSTPAAGGTPVPVAVLAVSPTEVTLPEGATRQLTAQTRDGNGAVLAGRAVTWRTSDSTVATVTAAGLVRALTAGKAVVTAVSEGVSAQVALTVTPAIVASVVVTPATAMLVVGDSLTLSAAAKDSEDRLIADKEPAWRSSDSTIVAVSEFGRVTARSSGTTTIVASVDGKSGSASITVRATFVEARRTLSAGLFHTCAVSTGGATYCWGHNGSDPSWGAGQLGDGSRTDRPVPTLVAGTARLRIVEASSFFSCGVDDWGAAWCWGFNGDGQLGDGSFATRLSPARVGGEALFVNVVAGYKRTCALTIVGALHCWGAGQQVPVAVAGAPSFATISSRGDHTCGVTKEGAAYCWGENGYGQLGNGSQYPREAPTAVRGTVAFSAISTGYLHTCALTPAGAAHCWGNNAFGQLGGTDEPLSSSARRVSGTTAFVALSSGYFHTCALSAAGDAYCWGHNVYGALGDGTTVNRSKPTLVAGGHKFVAIAGGGYHTCGLTATGAVRCWGRNSYGALGDGTLTNRSTPAAVSSSVTFRVP